jgi:hypothetical protein
MALHAADISNAAKAAPLYLQWVSRIMEEFFQQVGLSTTGSHRTGVHFQLLRAVPHPSPNVHLVCLALLASDCAELHAAQFALCGWCRVIRRRR